MIENMKPLYFFLYLEKSGKFLWLPSDVSNVKGQSIKTTPLLGKLDHTPNPQTFICVNMQKITLLYAGIYLKL